MLVFPSAFEVGVVDLPFGQLRVGYAIVDPEAIRYVRVHCDDNVVGGELASFDLARLVSRDVDSGAGTHDGDRVTCRRRAGCDSSTVGFDPMDAAS